MHKVFKHKAVLWLVVSIVLLCIGMGILNASRSDTTAFENVTKVIITPVQTFFNSIGHGVSGFLGYFSNVDKLNEKIKELEEENAELENALSQSEVSKQENEELRSLLNLQKTNTEFELEIAEIIARNPSNWYNTFTLNKGEVDGITVNMPVISAGKALVGRVCEVGTNWSTVSVITDPEHSAGAQVARSGELGICEGNSSISVDENLKLSFISKNADIIVGDTIVTSGLGGIYPKGLIIGKVLQIYPDIQGISQYAVIKPDANISNLKSVFIIKSFQ